MTTHDAEPADRTTARTPVRNAPADPAVDSTDSMDLTRQPRRRAVLRTAGLAGGAAAAAAALSACGGSGSSSGGDAAGGGDSGGGDSGGADSGGSGGSGEIAKSKVPVGSGVIDDDLKAVVTQPTEGDFKAFSYVCTHQGCPVTEISGDTIRCPCHGSQFSTKDGSVKRGPATKPLAAKKATVKGSKVIVS